jgi:hypothetical protein
MLGRIGICLVGATLVLFAVSCTKLPNTGTPGKGDIAVEPLAEMDSIPSNWGNLISVNNVPEWGPLFQLWFQDEKGTVRMVALNVQTNQFLPNARLIPRR